MRSRWYAVLAIAMMGNTGWISIVSGEDTEYVRSDRNNLNPSKTLLPNKSTKERTDMKQSVALPIALSLVIACPASSQDRRRPQQPPQTPFQLSRRSYSFGSRTSKCGSWSRLRTGVGSPLACYLLPKLHLPGLLHGP